MKRNLCLLELLKKLKLFNKTIDNEILDYEEAPAKTELSETMSKALKKQGFKFVGPVCVYSFLEAAGLINNHENDCDFNPHKNTV